MNGGDELGGEFARNGQFDFRMCSSYMFLNPYYLKMILELRTMIDMFLQYHQKKLIVLMFFLYLIEWRGNMIVDQS